MRDSPDRIDSSIASVLQVKLLFFMKEWHSAAECETLCQMQSACVDRYRDEERATEKGMSGDCSGCTFERSKHKTMVYR